MCSSQKVERKKYVLNILNISRSYIMFFGFFFSFYIINIWNVCVVCFWFEFSILSIFSQILSFDYFPWELRFFDKSAFENKEKKYYEYMYVMLHTLYNMCQIEQKSSSLILWIEINCGILLTQ